MSLPLPTIASRVMTFCPVSFPRTIVKLQGLLNNQNATASVITQLLLTDPLLCAGVLAGECLEALSFGGPCDQQSRA